MLDTIEKAKNIYGFNLSTFVDNVFVLNLLSQSYSDLKNDIDSNGKMMFESALRSMVNELFPNAITYECEAPIKCSARVDVDLLNLFTYGQFPKSSLVVTDDTFDSSRLLSLNNVLEYPINLDCSEAFSIVISTDNESRCVAEQFVQYLLYYIASNFRKGDVQFRCVDKKKNGQSFGKFISLIGTNKLFGSGVLSDEDNIIAMVSEVNQIAKKNYTSLNGDFASVFEYNNQTERKIPVTVVALCDVAEFSSAKSNNDFANIVNNAQSSAISTIFLTNNDNDGVLLHLKDQIHISFKDNDAFLINKNYQLPVFIKNIDFSDEQFSKLTEKLNAVEKVDTNFKSYYNLEHFELFSRDATGGIKIPFAFDENKEFVDFEIGDATPHALLSGSTGSGKSVTLHAIINQIMLYYHPADVEIWAIDYKAVEFGYYVNKRTPHITVIGQDNSEEFTFGLIDLIKSEYDRRKNLFVQTECKDFKAYRKKYGTRSISRILIVVDEFHNMTQAISNYMGEKDYKRILENLLSEMRAMGMSFLFCSQTIAAGLNGLTEKGRNQIGCRLSMKHQDVVEIKETLSLSLSSGFDFENVKYLRQGELIYKRISNKDGDDPYTLEKVHVLYTEPSRDEIIDMVNANIEKDYVPREEIICKNSNRYDVTEKTRHPISRFIKTGVSESCELLTIYPGAPTSLNDSFSFKLDEEAGNNVLLVGEDDSMRQSIIVFSVMSMLMDPQNTVVVSILDTESEDNRNLYNILNKFYSPRLQLKVGYNEVMSCISNLQKLKPYKSGRMVYLWYGLNKLKNMIFLNSENDENEHKIDDALSIDEIPPGVNPLDFLNNALSVADTNLAINPQQDSFGEVTDYKTCQSIIRQLEEYGPENNRFCFMVYNTFKSLKKANVSNVDNYEYRIGLKMSSDDSYDMFGLSAFISKSNDSTAVLYSGSKVAQTIRPYLMPNDALIEEFNNRLENLHGLH